MKTAVVYYSFGGTTRSYARAEAKARGADLIELKPRRPYNLVSAFVRGCPEAIKQKGVRRLRPRGADGAGLGGLSGAAVQQRGRAAAARHGGRGRAGLRQRKQ